MARINTIYDYLREYGPEMSDRILQSFPPLHAPDDPESPLLQELKRELLPAQKLVVMGLAKSLRIKPSAMLLGEMGTGKTICSLAASYVHAQGRPHSGIVMAAPHLVKKWAREIFMTIPNARVYLIHDMRNIKDPAERRKPHGVFEVILKNGEIVRSGWSGSLSDLRRMGRSGWRAKHPGRPTWFVLGRERGKLSYFWRNVKSIARSGPARGWMVNPDSGRPILNNDDVPLSLDDSQSKRMYEIVTRGKIAPLGCDDDSPALDAGHSIYAPLWTADRSKIQRVAPLEFVGRYMKRFFDFGIADEVHELNGDTAQGNGLSVLARAARRVMGLTGTILGGYAENCFGTLTRLDGPCMARDGFTYGSAGRKAFVQTYGVLETIKRTFLDDNRCSRSARVDVRVKQRPGVSPMLFGKYFLNSTAYCYLEDLADNLPPYEEEVIPVPLTGKLERSYMDLERSIKDALKEYPTARASIVSLMLNTLLAYPDHPHGFKPLRAMVPDEMGGFERVEIARPEELDPDVIYPKEERLIEDVRSERAQGRRMMVFATYTQTHDVPARLQEVLRKAGFRFAVMRASVPTDQREKWIADRVREGYDGIICHPKLVQTGLDLLAFETLTFYETGYSLYTLRQASRRSWRIGQKKPVRVLFYHYEGTMQERCLRLMGKKMLVSLAFEGKFSNEGLTEAADTDAGDILTALARELATESDIGESANAVWASLARLRPKGTHQVSEDEAASAVPGFDDSIAPMADEAVEIAVDTPTSIAGCGEVLAVPNLPHPLDRPRRRRSGFVDEAQMSLFALLEAA